MRSAKAVQEAVRVSAYTYQNAENGFVDSESRLGITQEAAKEILGLAAADGTIDYINFDETAFQVKELIYTEGDYYAVYENQGGNPVWKVYRIDRMIAFQ